MILNKQINYLFN